MQSSESKNLIILLSSYAQILKVCYTQYKKTKGVDIDFTKEPDNKKMGKIPCSVDSAGWYWSEKLEVNLNNYADKDYIIYITYRINGGFNGYIEDKNQN